MLFSMWLLAVIMLLLFEALVPSTFFFLSFAFGALCAAIAAGVGFSLFYQLIISLCGSAVSLLVLKVLIHRYRYSVSHSRLAVTNVDALVGQTAVITTSLLTGQTGSMRLAGEIWSCKNIGGDLAAGEAVIVVKVEGNKLFITKS